jgi:hypothetical protein
MRLAEGPASPAEIFLAWLLSLPDGIDVAAEVVRLDRGELRSRRGKRLRELFVAAAECAIPRGG